MKYKSITTKLFANVIQKKMEISVLATITLALGTYLFIGGVVFMNIEATQEWETSEIDIHSLANVDDIKANSTTRKNVTFTVSQVRAILQQTVDQMAVHYAHQAHPWEVKMIITDHLSTEKVVHFR